MTGGMFISSLQDLSRASDYFSEAGATPATKAFGRQNFLIYINGQKPAEYWVFSSLYFHRSR